MSLADILERAAIALPADADSIRPANGDPVQLLALLGSEGGRRVLSWLLCNEPDGGAEVALAWVDEELGAEVLGAQEEGALPKAGRRGLRKAVHRLRSRGVEVAPPRRRGPVVARLPEIEDALEAAYVSAIDPTGGRLVYLLEPNPSGGARLFEVVLDENRGIADFEVYSAGRSRIRRLLKGVVSGSRLPAVPVPPDALRALIGRVASNQPADRALPGSFVEWRSHVTPSEQGASTPGELAAAALAVSEDSDGIARASELVKKGVVGPWGPPNRELSERLYEVVEQEAAKESGEESWTEIALQLFSAEGASEIAAQRFEESAFVLWKLEKAEDARACLAGAEAFRSQPLAENLVAAAMGEALVGAGLAAMRARKAEGTETETEEQASDGGELGSGAGEGA